MDSLEKTKENYGFLWMADKGNISTQEYHFNVMQEAIGEPLARGSSGIDVGSGCGYDTYIMAKRNPRVNIVSIDISDGVHKTKKLTSGLDNVRIIKCSILGAPIKNNIFDFAYSFGVLHHTINPQKSLLEIRRILKKDSPVFVYLYEDHADNILKYIAVKITACIRKATVSMPPKITYMFCGLLSPFIFIIFSLPAKLFKGARIYEKIPFNFGTGFFSLKGDLYDRFTAPIEYRFGKEEVYNMFLECGFKRINITKLKDRAGWVAWGYKK